ncbi:Single-stranded DNA binding protein Ssb [Labeo rohita]|uniref:Single-stranded DNA binding protein Ssb n=1 Tax=Labeo rohita TaxID=84645 RepID=A0ABQ8L7C9_LABRO|nr:Single-stranded DNA binding protein Ssb [Labeo rohita]
MASEAKKLKTADPSIVTGYIHNVSVVKTAALKKNKYFNAVIQISRDDFCDVAVFSVDKRTLFLQAQNCRTAVRLSGISQQPSRSGEGVDVLCGRQTNVTVVTDVTFSYREPPSKSKRTVAEIKKMSARQHVGEVTGRIVHLMTATENVEVQGRQLETQSVLVEDASGKVRVQLWESQVGLVLFGKTYKFHNLSTREYQGELFVTTTRQTTVEEVRPLPGLGAIAPCEVREDPVICVCAEVTRAEVAVSRTCGNCRSAQMEFDPKKKYHRCGKCNMLQKMEMYQPSAIANVSVCGDFGELNARINNSVLQRYLRSSELVHLLRDGQDMEEHLLECGSLKLHIQNDNVVAMVKSAEETPSDASSSESSVSAAVQYVAAGEAGPVCATGDLELVCGADEVESMCAAGEAGPASTTAELEIVCPTDKAEAV